MLVLLFVMVAESWASRVSFRYWPSRVLPSAVTRCSKKRWPLEGFRWLPGLDQFGRHRAYPRHGVALIVRPRGVHHPFGKRRADQSPRSDAGWLGPLVFNSANRTSTPN